MIAGPSGFRVEVSEDGTLQPIGSTYGGLYGEATGQFRDLQRLWSTYRVNSVTARFSPASTFQLGSLNPTLTIVDVLGGSNDADFPANLGWYSRSKNLLVTEAYKPASRRVDYGNWLVQCVNKPFLRTDIGGRAREEYEPDDVVRLPGIQMGTVFTPSQNVSASASGYLIGYLDVNAQVEFRGRRLDEPYSTADTQNRVHPYLGLAQLPRDFNPCSPEDDEDKSSKSPRMVSVGEAQSLGPGGRVQAALKLEDLSQSSIQGMLKTFQLKR